MPAPLPPVIFDIAAAYPQVAAGRSALAAGDWPALRALVDAQDAHGGTILVGEVGGAPDAEQALLGVLAEHPEDPVAGAMLGAHLIRAGWRIRTAQRAQYVSRKQFADFFAHLRRAEQILIEVTARHPQDAAAWTQRVTSGRGLQVGQAEARRRYDRLAARHPHHLLAQASLLQQFCPKWSGTWEETHAFARECAEAAPPGAPNAVLVVEAYLEQALEHDRVSATSQVLRDPAVAAGIRAAAERSVWHPDHRDGWGWVWVRSTFALAFCLMQEWHPAAPASPTSASTSTAPR
ncbi:hypothetical protein [Micromonospora craniellae]|uniref:DUF4034 domain-containing protein n=1 Tax=Micromonospora craniellae TaxID=2294034 RepID=A0A372FRW0_9ACTN|nr:hypothetical protein [Micromonospora craniellae]QOC90830.1 hypothetical protein ID554_22370 [Micromonospora craniellae]RFS43326.1 hypothetical protein D0Q02_28480 [Micromonospora craniellae]